MRGVIIALDNVPPVPPLSDIRLQLRLIITRWTGPRKQPLQLSRACGCIVDRGTPRHGGASGVVAQPLCL